VDLVVSGFPNEDNECETVRIDRKAKTQQ